MKSNKFPRVVHILGKGEGWNSINDIDRSEMVYGCNDAFLRTPFVDKTFHMHDIKKFLESPATSSSTRLCLERARDLPEMDFITTKAYPSLLETMVEYPIEEISERFDTSYFTSTPEYMIAYALMDPPEKMIIHGINVASREEYIDQKAGIEFWLGMAMGMGVKVELAAPVFSSLFKNRSGVVYGYLVKPWRSK